MIQTFVRPAAGAVLFAARVTDIHPVVAMAAGLLVAGGVRLVKSAAVRPAVSVTTRGVARVPVSILIVLPTAFVIGLPWRRARREAEARGGKVPHGLLPGYTSSPRRR